MGFGIIVDELHGRYHSFTMADDTMYDGMVESYKRDGRNVICGRKGIPDKEIDNIADRMGGILKRLNEGEPLILKELESVLNPI